jgi:hypothetical protein
LAKNIRAIDDKVQEVLDRSLEVMMDALKDIPKKYNQVLAGFFLKRI